MNFIFKIIFIVIVVIMFGVILYIKYNSNFFLENSTGKPEKDPYTLDDNFLHTAEYEYNSNVLSEQMKTIQDSLQEYKQKIDSISNMLFTLSTPYLKEKRTKRLVEIPSAASVSRPIRTEITEAESNQPPTLSALASLKSSTFGSDTLPSEVSISPVPPKILEEPHVDELSEYLEETSKETLGSQGEHVKLIDTNENVISILNGHM